jgi:nucleoside-diphosphate-sugar epimerase
MTTNVFITGGTGVLGRPVVRSLVAQGHNVRVLAHSSEGERIIRELGATPVHANLFDRASVQDAVAGADAVLHLATRIPASNAMGKRAAWAENDRIRTEGTRNLVDAALAANVQTFVYPSVVLVYPDSGDRWIDAATTKPETIGILRSTIDAEREVGRFARQGRRGITLRMGNFYGPESGHTQDMLAYARKGVAAVLGAEEAYLSSIWIEDAARGVVAALDRAPSGTYDVVDDEPLPRAELVRLIAASAGKERLRRLPGLLARLMLGKDLVAVNSRSQRVSNRRFKEATGWAPQVPTAREGWLRLRAATPVQIGSRREERKEPAAA